MRKPALALLAAVTLVALLPFAAALLSTGLASALGCRLDEGSTHPCRLVGHDIGGGLQTAFVLGIWLSLPALPVLLAAILLWIAAALLRRRSAARSTPTAR